jgi:hypothetical protein
MTDFIKGITARHLIEMIANEYIELSHDKVRLQRDDHIKWCRQWLEQNEPVRTPLEQVWDYWERHTKEKECNGFCGEYECKENQANCKRVK